MSVPSENEDDDLTLLRRWAAERSEEAFRALTVRHAPLVWGAALRKTGGDRALAEEAAQQVFTDLAAKASALAALERPLAPWLHRAAIFEAAQALRRELRHRERVKRFAETNPPGAAAPDPWESVRPHLDDALDSLNEADRRVLLLHWYERRTFAEAAAILCCTPAAAQRRGWRALEKLASALRRRGAVAPSVALLAAGLTEALAPPVPASVTAALGAVSVSVVPAPFASALQQSIYAMSAAKFTTVAVVLLSAALPFGYRLAVFGDAKQKSPPPLTDSAPAPGLQTASTAANPAPDALDLSLVRQALGRLLENPEDYQTGLALRRLMFTLSLEEIPAVQKLLTAVPGAKREVLYEVSRALFARWAELNPPAAADAAFAVPKSAFGYYPLRGAFITWAATDLDAAWAWLERTSTDPMDRNFLGGEALATNTAFQQSGAAMMARVDAMTDGAWKKEMRFWVLRAWARSDFSRVNVMKWAINLPAERGDREEMIARAVELFGAERSVGIALEYLRHIENPVRRAEVAHNILWPYLLDRHPGGVVGPPDFVENVHERTGNFPPEVFRTAGAGIARHGAQYAMGKLEKFPEGPARDEFIQGMLSSASFTKAKLMLPALRMLDEETLIRSGNLSAFTQTLTRQDAPAAAAWIVSLPENSAVRQWTESHFQSLTGRGAADYLNSGKK